MALLKKLRGIDEGMVGGMLSEVADIIIADRKMDLSEDQLQASIDAQRRNLQTAASKASIDTYGAPGLMRAEEDGSIVMADDLFVDATNPVTGQPDFDTMGLSDDERTQLEQSMVQASQPYVSMRNPDGTLSPENEANLNIAMTTAQRNYGLSPKKVFNEARYGGQGLVLDESGTRVLTLDEVKARSQTENQKDIIDAQTESAIEINKEKAREVVFQLKMGQKHDFAVIAANTGQKKEILEAEYELRSEFQGNLQDFQRELKQMDIDFQTWQTNTNNKFAQELAREKIESIEFLSRKSFENEKAMAAINNNYGKELQALGFKNAKALKEYEFDNAWQVMQFLEKQKMARLEFKDDSRFLMYLTAQKDALAKEGRLQDWWKDQQSIVNQTKIGQSAKATLTQMPQLFMPITNQGLQWESSMMGYDEDDFISGANETIISAFDSGGTQAIEDLAKIDPENPMIQMAVDNIDHLLKTMGAPPDADGNYGEESQIDGALFGLLGKIDFYNATMTGETAANAKVLYESLVYHKNRIRTAQGK